MAATMQRHLVMPLASMPPLVRERIELALAQDEPPARWLHFSSPGSPKPMAGAESRAWYEWHWARGLEPDNRTTIPARVRRTVLARDGLVCQLCGVDVEPDDVHLDHIYPRSRGGQDTVANLQVTHSFCNMKKGARV